MGARYRAFFALIALTLSVLGVSCTGASGSQHSLGATSAVPVVDTPSVVVTYSVLAAFVERVVGDAAKVEVLIPDGQDPHDFEPSPRDIEKINRADFVVANGLHLEAGLDEALRAASDAGVAVFYLTDHVTLLDLVDVNDHSSHGHNHSGAQSEQPPDDHEHSKDPHVWLSPATMLEALPAMVDAASSTLSIDLTTAGTAFANELRALDGDLKKVFDSIAECQLVTGHNELGYFAQRYGCTVIAAIVASPSTTAEESAANVEFVIDVIKTHRARTILTSLGTNPAVAQRVADAAGVTLTEVSTHYLGNETGYVEFIRTLGNTIAASLR